ncbi:YncE family protein [Vineibacter terrae]|uniref:YncE family protein n=1 Tax=Vineibacter terrae TaxID=2586908 RepID=A0A5C8PR21_9HYPH|nr:YncE family protein [Vineibacter terrae]TXL77646.1 YncE family protein [Vineibacter terrae]
MMAVSPLRLAGYVELPEHRAKGGFDHAAVHGATGHVYVAHTANDTVDVFDPAARRHLFSIPDAPGAAGVLVCSEVVIVSNRAADTIGVFAPGPHPLVRRIAVGMRPNGLAYDPGRQMVLAANVGDPSVSGSHTLSIVGLAPDGVRREIAVPGRTRWAIFDPDLALFYVNIADPAEIIVVDPRQPDRIARKFAVPHAGPHGLDLDGATHRLFCACDAGMLVVLDARSGSVLYERPLSGVPDVVFFNRQRRQLYVAVGDPGVIDVFSTATLERLAVVETEAGSHTTALSPAGDRLYAFLPRTHRAAIYDLASD